MVDAKGGIMMGYDGFKNRIRLKNHVCVDEYSMPLG